MKSSVSGRMAKLSLTVLALVSLGLGGCSQVASNSAAHGTNPTSGGSGSSSGSGSLSTPNAPPITLIPTTIYMRGDSSIGNYVINEYTTSTSSAPTFGRTLILPGTFDAESVATDSTGQLYVGASDESNVQQVLIYPANSIGSAAPTRTLTLNNSDYPWALAVDATGLLYVGTQVEGEVHPVINVFSATASGTDAPLRTILLPNVEALSDIAVDPNGNLYVAGGVNLTTSSGYAIEVFSPTANGTATPTRSIISPSLAIFGVAADASGNIFANVQQDNAGTVYAIEQFDPTATGVAKPVNTINIPSSPSSTGGPVRLDGSGNIYTSLNLQPQIPGSPDPTFILYGYVLITAGPDVAPFMTISPIGVPGAPFAVD